MVQEIRMMREIIVNLPCQWKAVWFKSDFSVSCAWCIRYWQGKRNQFSHNILLKFS